MEILHAEGLSVSFGGICALSELSLRVDEGQIVGLIGPNGAGKTTALDALSGFVSAKGSVHLCGRDITRASPVDRVRAGLARTWQSAELFEGLTVGENLRVAAEPSGMKQVVVDVLFRRPPASPVVASALTALDIDELTDRMPNELSHGERKLVGVARALASRPRVVLLDEPSAGLDSHESGLLGKQLRALVNTGLSLVLVEHDMDMVLGICDHIYVIDRGTLISEGPPGLVQRDPVVIASYLGSEQPPIAASQSEVPS
jgi:branched-chain amino acid transport system ATP-binding protein